MPGTGTETHPPSRPPGSEWAASGFGDRAWAEEAHPDGAPLLRLFGAAALAILALAAASVLLV